MAETLKTEERKYDRRPGKIYAPAVDVIETNNNILVIADMPGVDEKTVDITLEKNFLTIFGMIDSTVSDDLMPAVSEYGTGDYRRVFSLSDEIDKQNIKATVRDGVLKLILPKVERAKTKRIEITGEA